METEIERMIVRLIGDGTNYASMLAEAQRLTSQAMGAIQRTLQDTYKEVQSFASSTLKSLSGLGMVGGLDKAFDGFLKFETGLVNMRFAIESNGGSVEDLTKKYLDFSTAVAQSTMFTKGSVMGLLQQAETMGFSGEAAKRLVSNTIALSKGNQDAAQGMLRIAGAIESGNLKALQRMFPQLRGIKDETELAAKAQQLLRNGMAQAQAQTQTMAGQITRLKKTFAGVGLEISKIVGEAIRPLIAFLTSLATRFQALSAPMKEIVTYLGLASVTLVSILPLISRLSILIKPLTMLIGLVFSPMGIALLAAGAAIAYFVKKTGGIEKAWVLVKEWTKETWDYVVQRITDIWKRIQPTVFLIIAGFNVAWHLIQDGIEALGEIIPKVFSTIYDWVKTVGKAALEWVTKFISENRNLLLTIGSIIAIVGIAIGVFKLLVYTYGLVTAALTAMKIGTILSTLLWVAWTAVIIVAKAALLLFTTSFAVFKGILVGSAVAGTLYNLVVAAYTPFALAATAATWLWNVALSATNVLLAGAAIAAAAVTIGGLVGVFAVLAGTVMGVYSAGDLLFTLLGEIPTTSGPIQMVSAIFAEWGVILGEVIRTAQYDMPRAMEFLYAGLALAGNQIRDIWPPLWTFISDGFKILAFAVGNEFKLVFMQTVSDILVPVGRLIGMLDPTGKYNAALDEMKHDIDEMTAKARNANVELARERMRLAGEAFKYEESAATAAARKRVSELRAGLETNKPTWLSDIVEWATKDDEAERMKKKYEKLGSELGAGLNKGAMKEVQKWEVALAGSAEAVSRVAAYQNLLFSGNLKPGQTIGALTSMGATATNSMTGGIAGSVTGPAPTAVEKAFPVEDIKAQTKLLTDLLEVARVIAVNTTKGADPAIAPFGIFFP